MRLGDAMGYFAVDRTPAADLFSGEVRLTPARSAELDRRAR
jgi:hypothetical protein